MPDLKDIIAERKKKKFVKKEYRPWDLGGNSTQNLKIVETSSDLNVNKGEGASNTSANPKLQAACKTNSVKQQDDFLEVKSGDTVKNSNKDSKRTHKNSISTQKDSIERSIKPSISTQKNSIKDSNKDSINGSKIEQLSTYTSSHTNENLSVEDIKITLKRLGGNEKNLFFYVINICSINGSSSTGEMLALEFDTQLNIIRSSRESAISRLVKKGILIREKGRRGRHSTLAFSVPEIVIREAINLLTLNQQSFTHNGVGIGLNKASNLDPYSSSNNLNITTTNERGDFPEAWENINIDSLSDIGFAYTQLKQLYRLDVTTPEIVQESINHFAFGLKNNEKIKKYSDPLNVLMGVLRRGDAWFEKNYRSPKIIAQQELLERKKAEHEAMKKLEQEAHQLAFESWKGGLTTSEIDSITSPAKGKKDIMPPKVKLTLYFNENVWPSKRKEYVG